MCKEHSKTAHVIGIFIVLDSPWPNVLPVQMGYEFRGGFNLILWFLTAAEKEKKNLLPIYLHPPSLPLTLS